MAQTFNDIECGFAHIKCCSTGCKNEPIAYVKSVLTNRVTAHCVDHLRHLATLCTRTGQPMYYGLDELFFHHDGHWEAK